MAAENPGAISGKDGDAYKDSVQICELTKWTFMPKVSIHAYASNCTGGAKRKVAGSRDASGALDIKWNPGRPWYGSGSGQMVEGDSATLGLYLNDNQFFTVPAIVTGASFEVEIDEGVLVSANADYEANGVWSVSTAEESSGSSSSSPSSSNSSSSSSS